jgi:hypothetical protein
MSDPSDDLDELLNSLMSKKEGMFAEIPQPKQSDYYPPNDPIAPAFDPGINMNQEIPNPRMYYPDLVQLLHNADELRRRAGVDGRTGTVLTDDTLTRVVRTQVHDLADRARRELDRVHECMLSQQKSQVAFNKIYAEIAELLEQCPKAKSIPR